MLGFFCCAWAAAGSASAQTAVAAASARLPTRRSRWIDKFMGSLRLLNRGHPPPRAAPRAARALFLRGSLGRRIDLLPVVLHAHHRPAFRDGLVPGLVELADVALPV